MLTIKPLLLYQRFSYADHHMGVVGVGEDVKPFGQGMHLSLINAQVSLQPRSQGVAYRGVNQRAKEFGF
jgi:hypothetical protein